MAQYDAQAVIPVDKVVHDYFPHLSVDKFLRKVTMGEIKIPLLRIEAASQKAAKGVYLTDLANYIDARHAAAVKEAKQMSGA